MKIKWESNSRVKGLMVEGKINQEDVVPRSRTDEFLDEVATVRMHRVRDEKPFVTIHIRGEIKKQTNPHGYSWSYAPVCRINLGGSYTNTMCSNGDLAEEYNWQDVHNTVEKVKEVMSL